MNFLHSPHLRANSSTSTSMFFSRLFYAIERLHVSFGFPTLLEPSGVQASAFLVSLLLGIRRTWPYQRHRWYLIFSITDLWLLLSLTCSSHTIWCSLFFWDNCFQIFSPAALCHAAFSMIGSCIITLQWRVHWIAGAYFYVLHLHCSIHFLIYWKLLMPCQCSLLLLF